MAFWMKVLTAGILAVLLIWALWLWQGQSWFPHGTAGAVQAPARIQVPTAGEGLLAGTGAPATAGSGQGMMGKVETPSPTRPETGQAADAPAASSSLPVQEKPLDDVTGLKLGTTLALLTQAYSNGGPMARTLVNVADDLAAADGRGGGLARSLALLRDSTPHGGPLTATVLVTEAQRILSLGAPDGAAQATVSDTTVTAAAATPSTTPPDSWWRRQLERFVTIRRAGEPGVDQWTRQLRIAQQQLARGSAGDARLTLTGAPLRDDPRLDVLRELNEEYLDQQGKLNNAINAYVQGYLKAPAPGAARGQGE